MTGFMRAIFGNRMLHNHMLESTAIPDAGVTENSRSMKSSDRSSREAPTIGRWSF